MSSSKQEYAAKVYEEVRERDKGVFRQFIQEFMREPEVVSITKTTLTAAVITFSFGSIVSNRLWLIPTFTTLTLLLYYSWWLKQ